MAPTASPRVRAFTHALLASTALVGIGLVPLCPVPVRAEPLPTGGQVVSGGVTIGSPSQGALAITQSSQNAIVNWQGFSVGQGHRVDIRQPNANAAILNRVTGATPSTIAGQLNANGQVYLVNPNGVTITKSGQINAAGFVASSLGITDEDFRAGRRQFRGSGASAPVSNHGAITIGRGGYAALIGGQVTNTGTIAVPMGRVGLGSGERATLDLSGDGFLQVAVPTRAKGRGALVEHSGTISAEGGSVQISAAAARDMARQAVNLSGVVEARSVSEKNGRITLSGDEGAVRVAPGARLDASGLDGADGGRVRIAGGRLDVAGTVDVSGAKGGRARLKASETLALSGRVLAEGRAGRGGRVTATAPAIATHAALIEASGATGGGTVRVGGGRLGQGPLARAEQVTVDAASTIRADATAKGEGGDVVVWSDAATRFAGTLTARGGAQGGDGGQAEVSSKGVLAYDGTTILTAAKGRFGTLLLDPYDITIANAPDSGTTTGAGTVTAGANDSVLGVATLESALANANVTVSTGAAGSAGGQAGTITVAAPLTWSSGAQLTLTAASTIAVNAPVTITGGGKLALTTATQTVGSTVQPLLSFGNGASVTFAANAGQSGQALTINGTGYTLVRDMAGLAGLSGQSGAYALATSLDAAGQTYGAAVIGRFSGRLEGLGHTIANLTIASADRYSNLGLIGALNAGGTVRDLGMVGGSVTANISVIGNSAVIAGGLVGDNSGTVSQSYATGSITTSVTANGSITMYAGGLVGDNSGTVSQSYATGRVTTSVTAGAGGAVMETGGLVGRNDAMVSQSYATGSVTSSSVTTGGNPIYTDAGGLVGLVGSGPDSNGTVSQSYATGSVTNNGSGAYTRAGGLVGLNEPDTNSQSYWDTQTSGRSSSPVGGFGQGLTTAQLQSGTLPAGFDPGVWATGPGLYPYLRTFFPNGVQAVSGTAYSNAGTTALASTAAQAYAVSVVTDGTARGTVSTGANGYYYVPVPAGTLGAGGSTVLAYSRPVTSGGFDTPVGAVLATTSGPVANLTQDIAGGGFSGSTAAVRYSALGIPDSVVAALPTTLTATGAGFTLDQPLTTSRAFSVSTVPGAGLTVAAPVTVASGGSLGLLSGGTLRVNAPVQVRGGATVALAYDGTAPTNLSFAQGTGLTFLNADGSAAETAVAGQSLTINGLGYTLIRTMADLDGIDGVAASGNAINAQADGLSGRYALARDLVATDTTYSNALVGTNGNTAPFSGTFEGLGHTLTGLTIDKPSSINNGDYAGLFGAVELGGTVRDLGLVGGRVSGHSFVGGLVGSNKGSVSQVYATGGVSGSDPVGGLVGYNNGGSIRQAYATGSVTGIGKFGSSNVGGLVGRSDGGSISQAYATGSVTGDYFVGGLVGTSSGRISQAYATGRVRGTSRTGGLVAYNDGGTITAGAWDRQTSGSVTGLGGDNNNQAGNVTGLTTAALQGNLPTNFDPATWATGPGLYPYLTRFFPTGVQVVSGTAQTALGRSLSGAQVGFYAGGSLLGGSTVSSGANGYVYQFVSAGTLPASGSLRIGATLTPPGGLAATGAIYTDGAALSGNVLALGTVRDGQNRQTTAQTSYGGLQGDLAATFGPAPLASLTAALAITATGVGFTLDRALTAGGDLSLATTAPGAGLTLGAALDVGSASLTLTSLGTIGQSAGTITAGRVNAAAASGLSLTGANQVGTVTGLSTDSGSLAFINATGFAVGGRVSNGGGPVSLSATSGDLTLASSARVSAAGDATLAAAGAFINNGGGLSATGGRWLVYSANSSGDTFGGLDSGNTAVWNTPAGGTVTQAGNRYVFAEQPTLTVTTTDVAKTYGEDAAVRVAGAYRLDGLRAGIAGAYLGDARAAVLSGIPTVTSAGARADADVAGTPYATTVDVAGLASLAGYRLAFSNAGHLTIDPATITVAGAAGLDKTYDRTTALPGGANGFTVSGGVLFDDAVTVLAGSARYDSPNAGSRSVVVSGLSLSGAKAGNYVLSSTSVTGSGTIDRADLAVSGIIALDKTYDGTTAATLSGTAAVTALTGDVVSVGGTGTGRFADKNAGTNKPVTVTGYTLTGTDAGNYALVLPALSADIVRATLTYTADAVRRTYGAANPALTGTVTGFVLGESLASAATGTLAFGTPATASSNVDTYAITGSGLSAGNYVFVQAAGNAGALTVDPAALSISGARTYDATTGFTADQITVAGGVNGETLTLTAGFGTAASADAGIYAGSSLTGLRLAVAGGNGSAANYRLPATGTLSITPAPVIVTARSGSSTYGDTPANPGLSATGLVGGEGVGVLAGLSSGFGLDAASAAGSYTLAVTGSLTNRNYRIDRIEPGTFTVDPRALTVTADALARTYGETNPATGAARGDGFVNGDGLTRVGLRTAADAGSGVGRYDLTAFDAVGTGLDNYTITYAPRAGGLTVTPRPVTLSGMRVYDAGTGIAGEFLTVGNRVDGDTVTVAGIGTLGGRNVGSQAITDVAGLTLSNANYTLAGVGGAVTITPATLTYTADAVSRTYGGANPALTGRVTGFLGRDALATAATGTLAFTADAGTGSNVGRYAVTGAGLVAGNYVLVQAAGNATALTVDPALLTLTGTRTYDATTGFHAGQLAVSGGVDGETVTLTAGSGTTASADAGIDAGAVLTDLHLSVSGGNGSAANYRLPTTGTLAITPATVDVRVNDGRSVYGDRPIDPGLSATGLVGGQDAGVLTGLSTGFGLDAASAAGRTTLTLTGRLANGNYRIGSVTAGTYTVSARPITVFADPQTRRVGAADPLLTYTVGGRGLVAGDRLSGGLATTAEAQSEPGLYPITRGSLTASANYSLGFVGADLAVLPAPTQLVPQPEPLLVAVDASRLASTAERAARLDGRPAAPDLPLLLGTGPGGTLVVADPRFDATLVCAGHQGGCFLASPVILAAPSPRAGLSYLPR